MDEDLGDVTNMLYNKMAQSKEVVEEINVQEKNSDLLREEV